MKDVIIPKRENKTKRLFVPITPSEHNKIIKYCENSDVKMTEMVRFALKEIFDF